MAKNDNKKDEKIIIRLQIEAGKASPAPPVGPALGSSGINIMQFVKEFNDKTASQSGMLIPVVITVNKDKSFTFITVSNLLPPFLQYFNVYSSFL